MDFLTAMGIRAGGLVAKVVIGIVVAVIGWTMRALIPVRPPDRGAA